jgi:hypothetical protein
VLLNGQVFENDSKVLNIVEVLCTCIKIEEPVSLGFSLRGSSKLLWRYLHKAGYAPCGDIFDRIEDEDVVSLILEDLFCSHLYSHSTRSFD